MVRAMGRNADPGEAPAPAGKTRQESAGSRLSPQMPQNRGYSIEPPPVAADAARGAANDGRGFARLEPPRSKPGFPDAVSLRRLLVLGHQEFGVFVFPRRMAPAAFNRETSGRRVGASILCAEESRRERASRRRRCSF